MGERVQARDAGLATATMQPLTTMASVKGNELISKGIVTRAEINEAEKAEGNH